MTISVVVPVYNSENSVAILCERLSKILPSLADSYEIILVNDGSRDQSWNVIKGLVKNNPLIHGFNLMRNFGQHNALLCGVRQAKGEIIVTLDDDLQHPPEEIPKLLEQIKAGYDVVYGRPYHQPHGLFRGFSSVMTKITLYSAMGSKSARYASAFRAFRTELRSAFSDYNSAYVSIDVLLTWSTTKFTSVEVTHEVRKIGHSNYNLGKLIKHALNTLTGFSIVPLQISSFLGICCMFFGLGTLVYVLGRYLLHGATVAGFTFLAASIAIFSGTQLLALGVMGEYIARIHYRTMGVPAYIIRDSAEKIESELQNNTK